MYKRILFLLLWVLIIKPVVASEPIEERTITLQPVFSENYQYYVTTLASDEFEGRDPLTPGGRKTKDFIEAEFKRIGLQPAYNGTFRQPVPVYRSTLTDVSGLTLTKGRNKNTLAWNKDFLLFAPQDGENVNITGSEVVFGGFGIVAPEFDWDDYKGTDLTGKTVVVFLNDPGAYKNDPNFFNGSNSTVYGSWGHKMEQAYKHGAEAVFFLYEEGTPGFSWDRMQRGLQRSRLQLASSNTPPAPTVRGLISVTATKDIARKTGKTVDELKQLALKKDFKPISLGLTASLQYNSNLVSGSYNIAGYIPGAQFPDETVIYLAHWDHLGVRETPDGPQIFNGAIDNATGTAAIMAIAERFASHGTPPARNVLFLAVTAEESGLLGARYYVENPIFPLETTAGVINIDMINVSGITKDLFKIGYGMSEMQDILSEQLKMNNRVLLPDPQPDQRYFYRSDHIVFARAGVPVIFTYGGTDFIGPDAEASQEYYQVDDRRYHTPDDIVHDHWSWEGIDQNLWIFYNTGRQLANSRMWPQWYDMGREFNEVRKRSEHLRQEGSK